MRQDADFITVEFLYMFRASCAHHRECKISCCVTLVFYLTLYYDARKHKIKKKNTIGLLPGGSVYFTCI